MSVNLYLLILIAVNISTTLLFVVMERKRNNERTKTLAELVLKTRDELIIKIAAIRILHNERSQKIEGNTKDNRPNIILAQYEAEKTIEWANRLYDNILGSNRNETKAP